ncbi:transmembrane protein 213 isoform X2 [Sturnira hondurensis]|uniref:transmembrane protein 213 isoform X2 n=1 Tax=Sturnira hondurensis TaxID=192404 RepID=UPI00187A81A0|nr:transmembrane protein 213 isoform X2 [Sturnira hondurensis]
MVQTQAFLSSTEHLTSVPPATLVLSLVLVSFHSACLAGQERPPLLSFATKKEEPCAEPLPSGDRISLKRQLSEASSGNSSALTDHHPDAETLEQCHNVDFCQQASRCCHIGVDEYGWIAAAVGWSLWFLTLILLCVDKLMKLTPEEPKDSPA